MKITVHDLQSAVLGTTKTTYEISGAVNEI
jgi:hypothetical protein